MLISASRSTFWNKTRFLPTLHHTIRYMKTSDLSQWKREHNLNNCRAISITLSVEEDILQFLFHNKEIIGSLNAERHYSWPPHTKCQMLSIVLYLNMCSDWQTYLQFLRKRNYCEDLVYQRRYEFSQMLFHGSDILTFLKMLAYLK